MLLSSPSLLLLLLGLLSSLCFSLCYCCRRDYHRFCWRSYRYRPSLYVIVVVVIVIAVTSVTIVIVLPFLLLSSFS